jgi:hypothetical protein
MISIDDQDAMADWLHDQEQRFLNEPSEPEYEPPEDDWRDEIVDYDK